MSTTKPLALQLAALCSWAAAGAAVASDAARHAEILQRLGPQAQRAYIERLMVDRRQAGTATDVTGPALTGFDAGTMLNVGKANWPYKIAVKATDDLSGVLGLYFNATGPSGQTIFAYAYPGYPALSASPSGGFGETNLSRMLEPGTWRFTSGYGFDVAGNLAFYDEPELAALGNTAFTVVNGTGYDMTGPVLVSGQITTAQLSLTARVPGAPDQPLFAGAKVKVTDAGNTALAGVRSASLNFCLLADPGKCISMSGTAYATGLASVTLAVGVQLSTGSRMATGTYELNDVYVYDHAGNYSYLSSTKFGGSTDFATLFPTTSIKINP